MKLIVLGSSSSGNGYILCNESEAIVIECGCPLLECEKAIGFNTQIVKAVLISHEHGDHAKYVQQYAERRFPVVSTAKTLEAMQLPRWSKKTAITYGKTANIGNFTILPFPTKHDAVEPCGFLIQCPDGSKVVFATDTNELAYRFIDIDYYLIECNYEVGLLNTNIRQGIVNSSVAERVRNSHLSLTKCISTLQRNDLSRTKGIVLLHLSENNSNPSLFRERIEEVTGRMVYIAKKNLTIDFIV